MNTYITRNKPIPGKPMTVIVRDELGAVVGEYVGYLNERRCVITLYPAKGAGKYYGTLSKHEISDRLIRVV